MGFLASLWVKIGADTKDLEKGLGSVKSGLSDVTKNVLSSMVGFASFSGAALAAGKALKNAIDDTVAYAEQVRQLSRTIGSTPEEASKLIQAADDVKVSFATIQTAMNIAIKKGIDPTIEGMGALADEYVAIQDPIARSRFLLDTFGKSGGDMAALMELGASGIRELGDAASDTGLVLNKAALDNTRNYEIALDNLNDKFSGMATSIGLEIVPSLTNLLEIMGDVTIGTEWLGKGIGDFIDTNAMAILQINVMALAFQALTQGSITFADFLGYMNYAFMQTDQTTEGLTGDLNELNLLLGNTSSSGDAAAGSVGGLAGSFDDAITAGGLLSGETDNLNKRFGFAEQAAKDLNLALDDQIKLKEALALASGKVTKEELDNQHAQKLLVDLAEEYGFTVDQISEMMIQLAINGGNVSTVIQMINTNLAGLPRETRMKILIEQFGYRTGSWTDGVSDEYGNPIAGNNTTFTPPGGPWVWYGKAFGAGMHGLYLNTETGEQKEFARGGHMQAGSPYLVGEAGPELVVPDQHSMVVPNDRLGMGGNDLLSAILRMPTAQDIAIAVRDAVLLVSK